MKKKLQTIPICFQVKHLFKKHEKQDLLNDSGLNIANRAETVDANPPMIPTAKISHKYVLSHKGIVLQLFIAQCSSIGNTNYSIYKIKYFLTEKFSIRI